MASRQKVFLFLSFLVAFPLHGKCADDTSNQISFRGGAVLEKPAAWDITQDDHGNAFLKPLGVSGIQILKVWVYPPQADPDYPRQFNLFVENQFWQQPWQDPSFWKNEPMSVNPQKYSGIATKEVFIRGNSWSCTRHNGADVSDIVNCYTFVEGGALVATYMTRSTSVSDADAAQALDDVKQVLNGVSLK